MHLPEIDKYAGLMSPFHSWDPRVKIVSLSALIVSIALADKIFPAVIGIIIAVVFVLISGIPFSFVLKQLRWVALFIASFLVIMPLASGGDKIIIFGFLAFSKEGTVSAVLIALRALGICLLVFPMVGTAEFHKSLKALRRLKVPDSLIQIIMFTYRYIFLFMTEFKRMFTAAKARLFKRKSDIYTIKTTGNMMGMLFIRGFERTQGVYNAMVSRGYKGRLKTLDEFTAGPKDFIKAFFVAVLAAAVSLAGFIL